MKLVIFAGGIGTRLWPLSRVNSPKQFDKIFNGASTLQLAFGRIAPVFGAENIFIQTVEQYKDIVVEQLPKLFCRRRAQPPRLLRRHGDSLVRPSDEKNRGVHRRFASRGKIN